MESTSENLIETSESSQSTGAVAYATVMEEAKWNAGSLAKLRHIFDKIIKRFPMDVRKENGGIFDKWDTLLTTVDRCTHWEPKTSSYLNLRLQNPPEEDGLFQVDSRMISLTQFFSNGCIQCIVRGIRKASQPAAK